ncbi:MAG: DNA primase, partial [Clostridia bacterium]|nr:DNA primase [Clostridia bacterium]
MTRKQAKEHIKDQLEAYLQGKMIDTSKLFRCLNPDHEDKNPSMGYNPDSKRVHCFSCGVTYDTLDVVGIDYGITSFNEKLQTASEIFNICLEGEDQPRIERIPEQIRKERKPKQHEKLQQDQNEYLAIAHNRIAQTAYPQQRGLSQETIDRFKLGYDPAFKTGGTTWQALIIPTSPTSYTVRNTDPTARKEDRIRKTGKSHLFNLEALEAGQPVFIVEGEIDAMSIVEAGGQAIGLGSTMNYQKLVKYLGAFPPDSPVLLALDNDKAGEETTEKLTIELDKLGVPFFKVDILGGYNNPDGYKDPNEALQKDREAFIEKIRQTELVQEEELRKEREEYHRNSAAGSIDSFINGIHARANTPSITTGFTELDNVLDGGLYEGLYIVGAISSLGKTTLITQIGDQIAQNKQDILLFSLEM